ncbi:MAG: AraC family transcriptional regulator [Clostridia bacterium]|nr:AraC family transcriptional regulator [Clostridia bacterium]
MYRESIEKVISLIESELKSDKSGILDNVSLSRVAGYSEYHFLRIFKSVVGITPADYIRKRRISEIVRVMCVSDRPISDIAFEYGFNSKENFTRAFAGEHGILPTDFRNADCSLRLYSRFSFEKSQSEPAATIVYVSGFSVTAYSYPGLSPNQAWNKYNASGCSEKLTDKNNAVDYGVMCWNTKTRALDYYIGVKSELVKNAFGNTVDLYISPGVYAVFDTPPATQHTFAELIGETWNYIYRVWLPKNGFKRAKGYEFECYTENSKLYTERIFVPIEKE